MSILSLEYLGFAAAVLLLYYVFPLKLRWLVLTAASTVFLFLAGWPGAVYLIAVSAIAWGGSRWIAHYQAAKKHGSGEVLAGTLTLILGGMAFIKYAEPLAGWITAQNVSLGLIVPLGLSWFSFQAAGYVTDVYRGTVRAEQNPLKILLFLAFFPQLAQGPVSTWKELAGQLTEGHRLEPDEITHGFLQLLWGYFKKLVLADRLATVTAWVCANDAPSWLIAASPFLYMVQLYADFSGGMDVVLGTARMLGIRLPENFRRPFFSLSVAEYWRRWHITLGTWFRSYLLYPLTTGRFGLWLGKVCSRFLGKRNGRLVPSALATVIIFFLIGIWHGASANAAFYGLYFGLLMAFSVLLDPQLKKLGKRAGRSWPIRALKLIRTLILVAIPQFFAFSESPAQAFSLMRGIFAGHAGAFADTMTAVMAPLEWWIALAAALILLAVDLLDERRLDIGSRLTKGSLLIRWPVMIFLIVAILVFGCYGDGFDAAGFLYTQF